MPHGNGVEEGQLRIELGPATPLRLNYSLDSGQVFRWFQEEDGAWYGTLRGTALCLRQQGEVLDVRWSGEPIGEDAIRTFLGLDDPLPEIRTHLAFDPVMRRAFAACWGARIVRQDAWEGLIAFICSSRNAIFRIQQMTACLAQRFGDPLALGERTLFTFPSASRLAELSLVELAPCRLGYRDVYVLEAARRVAAGDVDLTAVVSAPYAVAREVLMSVPGVGPKVADCILLMALGDRENAFPVDVWVRRGVLRHYRDAVRAATGVELAAEEKGLTDRQYAAIEAWARRYFAPYVGYAQTYLFLGMRDGIL